MVDRGFISTGLLVFLCYWGNKRTEVGNGSKVVCFVSVTKAFNGLERVIVCFFEMEGSGFDNACLEWLFGVFDIANRNMSNASFPFQQSFRGVLRG